MMYRVIGDRAEFIQINFVVFVKYPFVCTDIYYFAEKPACFFLIANQLAFKYHRMFIKKRSFYKLLFLTCLSAFSILSGSLFLETIPAQSQATTFSASAMLSVNTPILTTFFAVLCPPALPFEHFYIDFYTYTEVIFLCRKTCSISLSTSKLLTYKSVILNALIFIKICYNQSCVKITSLLKSCLINQRSFQ